MGHLCDTSTGKYAHPSGDIVAPIIELQRVIAHVMGNIWSYTVAVDVKRLSAIDYSIAVYNDVSRCCLNKA